MSCVRNWALAAALAVSAPAARAQAPSQEQMARDLNNYAVIVAGYEIDGRCQVLAPSQRAELASHIKVIETGFQAMGLPGRVIGDIAAKARTAGADGHQGCDAKTAETVERIGVFALKMGTGMAEWLAKRKPSATQ